eukprot:COSAG05_NODE_364_length_10775_cov_3.222836_10_plen_88_part_00
MLLTWCGSRCCCLRQARRGGSAGGRRARRRPDSAPVLSLTEFERHYLDNSDNNSELYSRHEDEDFSDSALSDGGDDEDEVQNHLIVL